MPRYLTARPPGDQGEAQHVRQLAHSVHAPADWIMHAKMVARSWEGLRARQIAEELGCHPQTVRDRLHAFNERGLDGLGMKPGSGRKPRLTEQERSTILALVQAPPPGKPTYELTGELAAPDPEGEPEWTLDTLTAAAQRARASRWRAVRCGASSAARGCAGGGRGCGPRARIPTSSQKGRASSRSTPTPPAGATVLCVDELGPVTPAQFPARSWLVSGWPSHQGAARLRARPREGLGLWRAVRARWAGR